MASTRERTRRFPPSSMPVLGPPHLFARDRRVDVFEPDARQDESLDAQVFYRSSLLVNRKPTLVNRIEPLAMEGWAARRDAPGLYAFRCADSC
jgi:hypothetical protein